MEALKIIRYISNIAKGLLKNPKARSSSRITPQVVPRHNHSVSRNHISKNAVNVVSRLHKAHYEAYLVGGCVRDLMLGTKPKDFDVVTNASPEQINSVFKNCRLVGRRFRLAHILFGREVIEVATFRANHQGENQHGQQSLDGMLVRDNVFGEIDDDAHRRDFTVNALYYDLKSASVLDYVGGLNDIDNRTLKMIGDPATRYREDPVRMLRAIRFAQKLDFVIDEGTFNPILEHAPLIGNIPAARLFEEINKLSMSGHGKAIFQDLIDTGLFEHLFPLPFSSFKKHPAGQAVLLSVLNSTDNRLAIGKPVTPAFVFAALLWSPTVLAAEHYKKQSKMADSVAVQQGLSDAVEQFCKGVMIPKRFLLTMREIILLQSRFLQRTPSRAYKLLNHPRFRAAYDFFELRSQNDDANPKIASWWESFQFAEAEEKKALLAKVAPPAKKRKSRKPEK